MKKTEFIQRWAEGISSRLDRMSKLSPDAQERVRLRTLCGERMDRVLVEIEEEGKHVSEDR